MLIRMTERKKRIGNTECEYCGGKKKVDEVRCQRCQKNHDTIDRAQESDEDEKRASEIIAKEAAKIRKRWYK